MTQIIPLVTRIWPYALAIAWGIAWALVLQWTRIGHFLAIRRTWVTVVIGIGVDMVIALAVIPFTWWCRIALIVILSSIGIIARSLINELRDEQETIDAAKAQAKKHIDLGT